MPGFGSAVLLLPLATFSYVAGLLSSLSILLSFFLLYALLLQVVCCADVLLLLLSVCISIAAVLQSAVRFSLTALMG
jgi:hypothetical protein